VRTDNLVSEGRLKFMRVRTAVKRPLLRWLVLISALSFVSCGGPSKKLNPVEGQVLHKGQPLAEATVYFHPKQGEKNPVSSTGVTDDQGKFTLQTGNYEGAPAGDYDVTIIKSVRVDGGKSKVFSTEPPETTDALKGAYADKNKTSLHATVKNGDNKLDPFRLDR
jgi:hypothetical protein